MINNIIVNFYSKNIILIIFCLLIIIGITKNLPIPKSTGPFLSLTTTKTEKRISLLPLVVLEILYIATIFSSKPSGEVLIFLFLEVFLFYLLIL